MAVTLLHSYSLPSLSPARCSWLPLVFSTMVHHSLLDVWLSVFTRTPVPLRHLVYSAIHLLSLLVQTVAWINAIPPVRWNPKHDSTLFSLLREIQFARTRQKTVQSVNNVSRRSNKKPPATGYYISAPNLDEIFKIWTLEFIILELSGILKMNGTIKSPI